MVNLLSVRSRATIDRSHSIHRTLASPRISESRFSPNKNHIAGNSFSLKSGPARLQLGSYSCDSFKSAGFEQSDLFSDSLYLHASSASAPPCSAKKSRSWLTSKGNCENSRSRRSWTTQYWSSQSEARENSH